MKDEALKNGYLGEFAGYRIGGKSFTPEGKEIDEVHEPDCFCCRANLLGSVEPPRP